MVIVLWCVIYELEVMYVFCSFLKYFFVFCKLGQLFVWYGYYFKWGWMMKSSGV